jgi:hypothetical protein
MKLHRRFIVASWVALILGGLVSCAPAQSEAVLVASFSESYVDVSIHVERDMEGKYFLAARFTPPEGYHLYSKDIPVTGIDGLGRPTLLELTSNSITKSTGTLIEDVKAEVPDFGPRELLVYPSGAVTLRLPVELPLGDDWIEDELQFTFMACSASQCKPPVVAKRLLVPIPGTGFIDQVLNEGRNIK